MSTGEATTTYTAIEGARTNTASRMDDDIGLAAYVG